YEDLPFTDPDFAAFQWLGARGLNPGYRATKAMKLSRGEAAGRLERILKFHGKRWTAPEVVADAPLRAADLQTWLKQAGYETSAGRADSGDLAGFAATVYAALRPQVS